MIEVQIILLQFIDISGERLATARMVCAVSLVCEDQACSHRNTVSVLLSIHSQKESEIDFGGVEDTPFSSETHSSALQQICSVAKAKHSNAFSSVPNICSDRQKQGIKLCPCVTWRLALGYETLGNHSAKAEATKGQKTIYQ